MFNVKSVIVIEMSTHIFLDNNDVPNGLHLITNLRQQLNLIRWYYSLIKKLLRQPL